MLFLQLGKRVYEIFAQFFGMLKKMLLLINLDGGQSGGAGEGVRIISKSAGKGVVFKIVGNFLVDQYTSQRYVSAGNTLCKRNDIRLEIKIFASQGQRCRVFSLRLNYRHHRWSHDTNPAERKFLSVL